MATTGRRTLVPLSPEWWATRLWVRLLKQQARWTFFDDYYTGQHPLPWLSPRAAEEFREILRMSRSNYMGLVVDAQVERMMVVGFRVSGGSTQTRRTVTGSMSPTAIADDSSTGEEGDAETWRLWRDNAMDGEFDKALLDAAICGRSYLLVTPPDQENDDNPGVPGIFVEHPSQAIVEHVPGSNRRKVAAGLKVYDDDWTATVHAVLYLPDGVYKFKQARASSGNSLIPVSDLERMLAMGQMARPVWEQREVTGESWPAPNPMGMVPLFELENNPRTLTGGRSELEDVTDIQDRVNKTLADRIITQDYGAFPQKWISGWPQEDTDGTGQPTIDTGRNRIVTTDVAETEFGQWQAAALDPYSAAKREDIKDIASRTRTPAQYLLGEMSNVNGQTLKASESGLVAKVRQRMRNLDDTVGAAMRAARRAAGMSTPPGQVIQVLWRNPEHRTEGELVDALTKMATLGVPQEVLWERWGATPEDIRRWKAMQDDAAKRAAETDPTSVLAARYRTLAGVSAVPTATPDQQEDEPSGKSATNNAGSRPGTPGASGRAGRPGVNGRPRGRQPAGSRAG